MNFAPVDAYVLVLAQLFRHYGVNWTDSGGYGEGVDVVQEGKQFLIALHPFLRCNQPCMLADCEGRPARFFFFGLSHERSHDRPPTNYWMADRRKVDERER